MFSQRRHVALVAALLCMATVVCVLLLCKFCSASKVHGGATSLTAGARGVQLSSSSCPLFQVGMSSQNNVRVS